VRRFAILLVLLGGCSSDERRPRPAPWTTYHDSAHAFTISFPPGWQRAREVLTPNLTDPHEILTLSTRRARPGGERCNHVPENAMRDLRRGDVLLTLLERRGSGGMEERPRPFVLGPMPHAPANECAERTDIRIGQVGFRDAGRGVHAFVTLGPGASAEQAERALDSLELEPAWRDRGLGLRLQPPTGWQVKAAHGQVALGSDDFPVPNGQACIFPSGAVRVEPDGGFVFLFEYEGLNRTQRLRFPGFPKFSLRARDRRPYECFGDSWLFRWRDRGRAFQAHAYLGARASEQRRKELLAALRSIVAAPISSR
jgi:hypothetical protein